MDGGVPNNQVAGVTFWYQARGLKSVVDGRWRTEKRGSREAEAFK